MKKNISRNKKYSKKRIKSKKKKENNLHFIPFNYSKNIKFILLFFILLIIGYFHLCYMKFHSLSYELRVSKNYKSFNQIKSKQTDPFFCKILREIRIIKHLFSNRINSYKKRKNIIHITVGLNNNENYKYILLVSMYSLLSNCNTKTFVIYHILCTPDFNESSVDIFKSLMNKFYSNVEMIFYNMGNIFENRKKTFHSLATFYRIVGSVFIDSDRLIHLDGDTLTFSDLSEMYNLDFNDNYILGLYDYLSYGVDYLGIKSKIYINAGVILINLKKIREDNKTIELINMANSNMTLSNEDQTIFNYVFYPKIGRLPSKYAIFNFEDKSDIKVYIKSLRTKIPYEEVKEAFKNPIIIHQVLCYPKPWYVNNVYTKAVTNCAKRRDCSCKKYFDIWHSFANHTDYYGEISKFTGIKKL